MKTSKWLCATLVAVLAWAWFLAPLPAMAQAPPPPPPPPSGVPPGPPPYEPSQGAKTGAAILNVVYVPGKAILCGGGTLAGGLLMLLTFGSAYRAAVNIFNEGCGGNWTLSAYDVAGKQPPEPQSY